MPNKNYLVGYRAELRAKHVLESDGYIVVRASGSKGVFDLIAISSKKIRLIQVKAKPKKKEGSRDPVEKGFRDLKVPDNVSREVWYWIIGYGFKKVIFE